MSGLQHTAELSTDNIARQRWVGTRDDIRTPELKSLFDYWTAACHGKPVPSRADLDPVDMARWLPHIILADVNDALTDIRFRLIGTWVVERVGEDDTGKSMQEIGLTEARRSILDTYLTVARFQKPLCSDGWFYDRSGRVRKLWAERLLMPMHDGENGKRLVLSALYFDDTSGN